MDKFERAIKRQDGHIEICDIRIRCGHGNPEIEQMKQDCELAIVAIREMRGRENNPLTLDELRKMDGEPQPVYLVSEKYTEGNGWKVCYGVTDHEFINFGDEAWAAQVFDGHHVIAYRRKPEGVQK